MKHQTRNDKIENCLVMIDAVKSLPPRAFIKHLAAWECGSAACLGGWVGLHPYFQAKGVVRDGEDAPYMLVKGDRVGPGIVSKELFGDYSMFDVANALEWHMPGKEIALRRLNNALNSLLDGISYGTRAYRL